MCVCVKCTRVERQNSMAVKLKPKYKDMDYAYN